MEHLIEQTIAVCVHDEADISFPQDIQDMS